MRTASLQEFFTQLSKLPDGDEVVLITRGGQPAGVFYPLTKPDELPRELQRTLFLELSSQIASELGVRGVSEETLQGDFEEFRRRVES